MSDREFDVVCVGSALLDVYMKSEQFVKIPAGQYEGGVALCEEFGGKTEVEEVEVCSGGGGSNNAVSFARKGFKTGLVAEMGKDLVAATILEEMQREGVNTSMVIQEEDEDTGISSIMVATDGGRSVAVHRGASRMLTKTDIDWERLKPGWLYISSLGGEMALFEGLIGHAKYYGVQVAVNPGMSELSQLEAWGGMQLFDGVSVLIVNREEASVMTGEPWEDDAYYMNDHFSPGPTYMVVTDGKRGGVVCEEGLCTRYDALETEVVEETGAGDAFGSGFVAGLMHGMDVAGAVTWGVRQAASVVGYMGAKRGLLRLDQIA